MNKVFYVCENTTTYMSEYNGGVWSWPVYAMGDPLTMLQNGYVEISTRTAMMYGWPTS